MKGWTYSSLKKNAPETTKTKEVIRLEDMKQNVEKSDLEWGYFHTTGHRDGLTPHPGDTHPY